MFRTLRAGGVAALIMLLHAVAAQAAVPIVSDSRIKTLIYNPNDVYSLLTHYGYQSNIEFALNEVVQTVSVGDRVAWQIIPAGQRLFIKAMEEGANTNMTVVTNKRAYQFDLRSSERTPLHPSEELVYVVRFFYPEEQAATPYNVAEPMPAPQAFAPPQPDIMPMQQMQPMPPMQAMPMSAPAAQIASVPPANYRYTLSGPEAIAPVQVYDDGRATYLRFRPELAAPVQIFIPLPDGSLQALPANRNAQGELMVPTVQPRLLIQSQGQQVMIYNESVPSA